jgi:hypothetical protein
MMMMTATIYLTIINIPVEQFVTPHFWSEWYPSTTWYPMMQQQSE